MANDTFRVARSIHIDAPAAEIFPHIDDFHAWVGWSPFEKMDAVMQKTYSGAARGVGAQYAWVGKKAGAGSMEILKSDLPSRVVIDLKFTKPFKANNMAEFTLEPKGDTTQATWAIYGPSAFVTKVMGLFFDMDTMIGKDFEAGLADLKAAAEKQ